MGARKKSGRGVFWTTSELRPVDDCSPGRGGMAQDGGARGGTFHGEKDRCRESQGWLRHAVICPNVTGRTKERTAQSKRARAGSLAIVDSPQVARTCILQADVVLSFSGVTFILCFVTTVCVLFRSCFFLFFCFFGDVAFSEYFLYHYRFLFVWRIRRIFFPSGWCFSTM